MRVLFSFFWCSIIGKQPMEDLTSIINIFSNIVQMGKNWQKNSTQLKQWSNEANLFSPKKNINLKKNGIYNKIFLFFGSLDYKISPPKDFFCFRTTSSFVGDFMKDEGNMSYFNC